MSSRLPRVIGALLVAQFVLVSGLTAYAAAGPSDAVTAATPTTTTLPRTTTTTTSTTTTTTTTLPPAITTVYPSDSGIVLERGSVCMVEWSATNLPKGAKVQVELVKGGTQTWILSAGATKSPLKWTVGAIPKGAAAYPDGNDYRIRVRPVGGNISDESGSDFAISGVTSISVSGPSPVMCGGAPASYTCTAHYSFGPDRDVTNLVKWSSTKVKGIKMGKTGILATTAGIPSQSCTIMATYGKGKPPLTGSLDVSLTTGP